MKGLDGRVAIVTGGAGGIGRACARALHDRGARVVIGDKDGPAARRVADELGGRALAVKYDAADAASTAALVERAVEFGGRLDVLHNNAALTAGVRANDGTVVETSLTWWDRTMTVNLRSVFVATQAAIPHFIRSGGGSIINTGSIAGSEGRPHRIAYSTSKAALAQFSRCVAVQYGKHGIRTNCVAPGTVLSDSNLSSMPEGYQHDVLLRLPATRLGTPKDIADLVAFLASDEASFINGQIIHCDGGYTAGSVDIARATTPVQPR